MTITEVAQRAGVSMKTVSRVLNAEPHVREEVRERVLQAAKELRYRPKVSARSLAGSRSYVVGYLIGDPSVPYITLTQLGALSACRKAGYHLLLEFMDLRAPDLQSELETLFTALTVDGVLLTPPHCDHRGILDALDRSGAPYVRISPDSDPTRSPYVEADDRRAAREMTDYLAGLGHRDIAFITGPPGHSATRRRLEGYREALAGRGIGFRPELVVEGDFTFASGRRAAETLLGRRSRPTAIFASNDNMAAAALGAAQEKGLRAPEDISIAGFDDIPTAQMVWPGLTTMRQPIAEMAAAATEILIAGAGKAAPASGEPQLMQCELVIRGSTAPRGLRPRARRRPGSSPG